MKYPWIDEYLKAKRGVTQDLQAEWNWIRYQIGGKMFAAVLLDDGDRPVYINLKLEPLEGELMRSQYPDIIPGYYSNKQHWNSVKPDGEIPDDLLKHWLDLLLKKTAEQKITSDACLSHSHGVRDEIATGGKPESRQEAIVGIDKHGMGVVDQKEGRHEEHVETNGAMFSELMIHKHTTYQQERNHVHHQERAVEGRRCEENGKQRTNGKQQVYVELYLHVI